MSKHYYTNKDYTLLKNSMIILVDTREQDNKDITDYFDKKKINWKSKALETGDYSFMIPKNEELGFLRDTYFTEEITIDKKHKVDEIAGNLTEKKLETIKASNISKLTSIDGKNYTNFDKYESITINTDKKERFINEIIRMSKIKNSYILVENDNIDSIIEHKYRSQYNELAFLRTWIKFEQKYGVHFVFCKKENMGKMIYEILKTALDLEILK